MKCINCGAELSRAKCDYCGTSYENGDLIVANFNKNNYMGTLTIGDQTYSVYVASMQTHLLNHMERNEMGQLIVVNHGAKHTFTLVEE